MREHVGLRGYRQWVAVILVLVALAVVMPVAVQASNATGFVKDLLDKVMAIQNNPGMAGEGQKAVRAQRIRDIIKTSFDFPAMAKESLGSAYGSIGSGQRQEFENVFSHLFTESYTRLVLNFLKQENIKYLAESSEGGRAQVKTEMVRPNETIRVDYLLQSRGGKWALYDVIVDNVSILDNYKRQFGRVIQTQSFAALLQKMKQQSKIID